MSEVLPALIGSGESLSLQMMSLASTRLVLEDGATSMAAQALANCTSLRLLCLDGWTLRVDVSILIFIRANKNSKIHSYIFIRTISFNVELSDVFHIACIFHIYFSTRTWPI